MTEEHWKTMREYWLMMPTSQTVKRNGQEVDVNCKRNILFKEIIFQDE